MELRIVHIANSGTTRKMQTQVPNVNCDDVVIVMMNIFRSGRISSVYIVGWLVVVVTLFLNL